MEKTLNLSDANAPEDVCTILRSAAESFDESQGVLDSAWSGTNGDVWAWLARRFESFAAQLEREIPKHL